MKYHTPVLLQEIITFLDPKQGDLIIDATAGGGEHTEELLKRGAKVLALDRDPEAIEEIRVKLKGEDLVLQQGNFDQLEDIAKQNGFTNVKGILFDLGVSSHQLDTASRGFSFTTDGPLDMRMDPSLNVKASDLVNNLDQRRLDEIFKTYGQEKFSWVIARAICSARQVKPIETTRDLARIIDQAVQKRGVRRTKINPATKSFQALRIVVNSELLNLEQALPQTQEILKPGGRLAVISFHSLEDGIVKRFFKGNKNFKGLTKKPIGPGEEEIATNPRARSARLRVAEKI